MASNDKDHSSCEEVSSSTLQSSGLTTLRDEADFKRFLHAEVDHRTQFAQTVVEYMNKRKDDGESVPDLIQRLKDADGILHSLLETYLKQLTIVERRDKDAQTKRNVDSGIGASTEDTRRNGVRISHTDAAAFSDLPRHSTSSTYRADLSALPPRTATENSDNDSDK
ncbi:hypothetical protein BaRGS_00006319 [Batillaria attramentaria]|uniref:Uncharacterized protein n=1 Tax=Batillaria attramentaria TaxID=370345 RepID=A0ABD0LTG9_9CAEN